MVTFPGISQILGANLLLVQRYSMLLAAAVYNNELCNSCNMGMRDLSDMYSLITQSCSLRAYISGKSKVPMVQVICIISGTLKNCPNLQFNTLYINIALVVVMIMGSLFQHFHDVSLFIQCIIVVLIMGLKLNMCNNLYPNLGLRNRDK